MKKATNPLRVAAALALLGLARPFVGAAEIQTANPRKPNGFKPVLTSDQLEMLRALPKKERERKLAEIRSEQLKGKGINGAKET